MTWYLNGKQQTGNPATLIFKPHQEIAFVVGTPPAKIPSTYKFLAGRITSGDPGYPEPAGVAKLVIRARLKIGCPPAGACGFESRPRHSGAKSGRLSGTKSGPAAPAHDDFAPFALRPEARPAATGKARRCARMAYSECP